MNSNPTPTAGGLFGSLAATGTGTGILGSNVPATQPSFGLGGFGAAKPANTVPATSSFGAAQPAATSGLFGSLGSTGFNLGGASSFLSPLSTTSAAPVAGTLPLSTVSSGFSLTGASSTLLGLGTAPAPTSSANVAPAAGGDANAKSVNFAQMDEAIQKWTLELVEHEKTFLNQIDQIRDWDRLLLSTGDKITTLNDGMQKVKLRQQQLDHELDFIVAQQRELAECLEPLENEFGKMSVSDPERDSVYQRAENLNTQLQRISEDLKGVIEHINDRNRTQDTTDPIIQIGRILNAHMNSLQWVDQNTSTIQQMLDQITKMRDIHRRDADSTQNL